MPGLADDVQQDSGGWAPDTASRSSATKNGHARHADLAGGVDVGRHVVGEALAGEDGVDLVGVEAHVERRPAQGVVLADGLAVGEVGPAESVLELELEAAQQGEVEQAVGVEGVAADGLVEAEVDAPLGAEAHDAGPAGP